MPTAGTGTWRGSNRGSATGSGSPVPPSRGRAAGQPRQAAARPLRQGGRRRGAVGPAAVRLPPRRRRPDHRHQRLGGGDAEGDRDRPRLRLGSRPAPEARRGPTTVIYEAHVARPHPQPPRGARRPAGHLRRSWPTRHSIEHFAIARDHRGGADAGAPLRPRPSPGRPGPAQLLGLQLHRLPGPPQRLRIAGRPPGRQRVQGHGARPARGRHRGHPRRRLQPHRRGQPPRARPCRCGASTTPATTA